MIRYALACEQAHAFESWFPSSTAYDDQAARGLVRCPVCDSMKVEKQIMAPALGRSEERAPVPAPTAPPAPQPVALLSEKEQAFRAMLRAVREHVERTADYVGPGFATEARRMHEGEIEHRSIYGEASADEVRALHEDGIDVHPLPLLPDDRH